MGCGGRSPRWKGDGRQSRAAAASGGSLLPYSLEDAAPPASENRPAVRGEAGSDHLLSSQSTERTCSQAWLSRGVGSSRGACSERASAPPKFYFETQQQVSRMQPNGELAGSFPPQEWSSLDRPSPQECHVCASRHKFVPQQIFIEHLMVALRVTEEGDRVPDLQSHVQTKLHKMAALQQRGEPGSGCLLCYRCFPKATAGRRQGDFPIKHK